MKQAADCRIVHSTVPNERSMPKRTFITSAMDCREYACFATALTTTSPTGESQTSVSVADWLTSVIAS